MMTIMRNRENRRPSQAEGSVLVLSVAGPTSNSRRVLPWILSLSCCFSPSRVGFSASFFIPVPVPCCCCVVAMMMTVVVVGFVCLWCRKCFSFTTSFYTLVGVLVVPNSRRARRSSADAWPEARAL